MNLTKIQTNATSFHQATSPRTRHTAFMPEVASRPTAEQLIEVYGMWAHRAVQIKASVAASIPFRLFALGSSADMKRYKLGHPIDRRTKAFLSGRMECAPQGTVRKAMQGMQDDMTEIVTHPILELLDDINEWTEGFGWLEHLYTDLDIFGVAYEHMVYDRTTRLPVELWRMLPHLTKVIPGERTYLSHFEYGRGEQRVRYDPDDVLWFRLNDPANPWGGYSWVSAWLTTLKAMHAIAEFQWWLMDKGGMADWLVIDKKSALTSDTQKNLFRRMLQRWFGKLRNRHENVAIMSGDLEVERLGQTNKELEFTGSADQKRDEVFAAAGVPKSFADTDKIAANSREAMNQFKRLTVWPTVQRVQEILNQRFVKKYWSDRLVLIADNPIEEDRTIRLQERVENLKAGHSVNEERMEDGLEPLEIPEADVPLIGTGVSPVEGMLERQALEMDGMRAANEMQRNPPPQPAQPPDKEKTPDEPPKVEKAAETPERACSHYESLADFSRKELGDIENPDFDGHPNPAFARAVKAVMGTQANRVLERIADNHQDMPDRALPADEAGEWADEIVDVARSSIEEVVKVSGEAAVTVGEGISFDLQNDRVQDYLENQSRRIGRQATDTYRAEIRQALLDGVNAGESTREIAKRIEHIKGAGFVNWKADMIARTETAFAFTQGNIEGWRQSGVVVGKQFVLAPDACPYCRRIASEWGDGKKEFRTAGLDEPLKQVGDVIPSVDGTKPPLRVDYVELQGPPVHPHCRCSLRAVIQEDHP